MRGTYLHASRRHGFGFAVGFRGRRPHVEASKTTAREALESTLKTLNPKQTQEHLLQNLALVLPEKIGEYKLDNIQIKELKDRGKSLVYGQP